MREWDAFRDQFEIIHQSVAQGAEMFDVRCRPGFQVPPHRHGWGSFHLVFSGALVETYRGEERRAAAGTLLYHAADAPHETRFLADGARVFHVPLRSDAYQAIDASTYARDIEMTSSPFPELILGLFREFLMTDTAAALSVASWISELTAEFARKTSVPHTTPSWIDEARDWLHDAPDENPSLNQIARHLDRHRSHVARAFRARFGCTMGNYVRRLRIRRAADRLVRSDETLASIAHDAGFADQSHFGRVFKRFCGHSPAVHRSLFNRL